jgi:hypothetical protein
VAGEALRTARLEAMVEHRKEQKRKEAEEAGLTKVLQYDTSSLRPQTLAA